MLAMTAAMAAAVTIAGRSEVLNCERKMASRDAFPATWCAIISPETAIAM